MLELMQETQRSIADAKAAVVSIGTLLGSDDLWEEFMPWRSNAIWYDLEGLFCWLFGNTAGAICCKDLARSDRMTARKRSYNRRRGRKYRRHTNA